MAPSPRAAVLLAAAALLAALATLAALPIPAAAQERPQRADARPDSAFRAITYLLHPLGDGGDVTAEPATLRVIQGPRFAWLLQEGASPAMREAELVLDRNAPLVPGPGPLLVRGWTTEPGALGRDSVAFRLTRGSRDRDVAGRPAEHYELRSTVEWVDTAGSPGRRYQVTADFWVLPDLPFTWAPFGSDRQGLPALLPALRDTLTVELERRGLVARAVLRLRFAVLLDGVEFAAPEQVTGFEVSDLRLRPAPPAPAPIIERSVIDALERLLLEQPDRTCRHAADGELPAIMRARLPHPLWPPLIGLLSSRCRR